MRKKLLVLLLIFGVFTITGCKNNIKNEEIETSWGEVYYKYIKENFGKNKKTTYDSDIVGNFKLKFYDIKNIDGVTDQLWIWSIFIIMKHIIEYFV